VSRFSEAISEGDGISVVPVLEGDVGRLAEIAEATGAEAVAVRTTGDARRARAATQLPVVVRGDDPEAVSEAGADACILVFDSSAGEEEVIDELYALARDLDLDCVVGVRDEDGLEEALERVDPDIILISSARQNRSEEELERALDLLPDVPAGKLVIAETSVVIGREQVLALERAGVDAVLVAPGEADFGATLADLTGRTAPS
jgi:indole-3-glycerol phosphate synthase